MAEKGTKRTRGAAGVGAEIFEQVEKMVAEQQIGRTEAFRRLAAKTGRQQGTVAANYYRIARQRGAKLAPRRRRGGAGGGDSRVVLRRALAALDSLGTLIRSMDAQIVELRKENQRLAAIRRLIAD